MAITLYPFQARGLDEGRAAYRAGRRAVLFVGPTGMGKTTLAAAAATGVVARGRRVVAVAHRRELVVQMARRLEAMGLAVGYLGRNAAAPVQVRSVQAILASREMPSGEFVILDEAHHYVSNEWIVVARTYLDQGAHLMGLTATPTRDDGRALGISEGGIFDALVDVAQVSDLVALNAAEPDKGITPIDVLGPEESVRRLAQAPHEAYLERARDRYAVVFAPNVLSAEAFHDGFRGAGIAAELVHGEVDTRIRDAAISRFARGDVRVLINVNVLTEGWDAPICDVCILARKIGSFPLLVQMIGRARRARLGKGAALLIDLSGNLALHGNFHPDDPIVYSLSGEGMSRGAASGIAPRICRVCKRVLDDDLARAKARGEELSHCPECNTPISRIVVPTPEEVALRRVERDDARARAPLDKTTKALATLYVRGLRDGKPRKQAEAIWRRMFLKGRMGFQVIPSSIRVPAWASAVATISNEKGDAWCPPDDAAGAA